jgi:hypothetical protein
MSTEKRRWCFRITIITIFRLIFQLVEKVLKLLAVLSASPALFNLVTTYANCLLEDTQYR